MEQARARDDTMADNDRFVSPYLLRPLRTLNQVLGGRGRALEPHSFGGRQTQARQVGSCETVDREHRSLPFTTTG